MRLGGKKMKKTHKTTLIAALLSFPLLVGCAGATQSFYSEKPPFSYNPSYNPGDKIDPIKIFDYFEDDGYPGPLTFELKEFSVSPFTLNQSRLVLDSNGGVVTNAGLALYVYDANDDGYRDFCIVDRADDGLYNYYIRIYDYKNKREIFNYNETERFSYFLKAKDRQLCVFQTHQAYNDEKYGEGVIVFNKDKGVEIKWDNCFDIKNVNFEFTYADVDHSEVNFTNRNGVYTIGVNRVCTYLITLDVEKSAKTIYPSDFVMPVSFISSSDDVVIFNPLEDRPFTYALYFEGTGNKYNVDMVFSGFKKTLVFNVQPDYTSPFINLKLSYLLSWASQTALPNIQEIDVKEEILGRYAPESSRGIGNLYQFTDDSYLDDLSLYFDEVLFEIDPDDFVSDDLPYYTYIIKTDQETYEFEGQGNYFYVSDRCFMARKPLEMNRFHASNSHNYFDQEVTSIYATPLKPGLKSKTISNPEDFTFTKRIANEESVNNAQFSFTLKGATYYILDNKSFLESSGRYVYEITSDADFSTLFA